MGSQCRDNGFKKPMQGLKGWGNIMMTAYNGADDSRSQASLHLLNAVNGGIWNIIKE